MAHDDTPLHPWQTIDERFKFFLEHAGYAEPPGLNACALSLAEAEEWAAAEGLTYDTRHDEESHDGPRWVGAIFLEDECLQSLGGIDNPPGDTYHRVVAAELASEYKAEHDSQLDLTARHLQQTAVNLHNWASRSTAAKTTLLAADPENPWRFEMRFPSGNSNYEPIVINIDVSGPEDGPERIK